MPKPEPYRCWNWPNCICNRNFLRWMDKLKELIDNPVPEHELREEMYGMYCMLLCIEHSCPDREWRRIATVNLMHPVWTDVRKEIPR